VVGDWGCQENHVVFSESPDVSASNNKPGIQSEIPYF